MGGIKLSGMDQVEAWKGGAILPPGRHQVIIDSADETESSGGHPQVELTFVATNGSGDIRDWLTFAQTSPAAWEASLGRAKSLLEAVGIEAQGGDWEFPTDQLPGKRLTITVAQEPKYNDPSKMVNKVKAYQPASEQDSSAAATIDDSDLPF